MNRKIIEQVSVRGLFLLFVNCIINKREQIDRIEKLVFVFLRKQAVSK